jgi:hypothetical protein
MSTKPPKTGRKNTSAKAIEPAPTTNPSVGLTYALGDPITHPKFGDGTVMAIDAHMLTIKFAGGEIRRIVEDYVKPRKS